MLEEVGDSVQSEGQEIDVLIIDEGLQIADNRLGRRGRQSSGGTLEESGDTGEGGYLEGTMNLAEEGGDFDEAFLHPLIEFLSFANGRRSDFSDDLDRDQSRHLVLESIPKERQRRLEVTIELISSMEENNSETSNSLSLDFFIRIAARQSFHRSGVDLLDVLGDGGSDRRDGGNDGSKNGDEIGTSEKSFGSNLVEFISDGTDEKRDESREFVEHRFGVMSSEEEGEEGEDFDFKGSRGAGESAVGGFERCFDSSDEGGDLRFESTVEDSDELVEEGESGLSTRERFRGEFLDDRLGDSGCLYSQHRRRTATTKSVKTSSQNR